MLLTQTTNVPIIVEVLRRVWGCGVLLLSSSFSVSLFMLVTSFDGTCCQWDSLQSIVSDICYVSGGLILLVGYVICQCAYEL
jgi:hypothetical protein